jgi:hypothetical protein
MDPEVALNNVRSADLGKLCTFHGIGWHGNSIKSIKIRALLADAYNPQTVKRLRSES